VGSILRIIRYRKSTQSCGWRASYQLHCPFHPPRIPHPTTLHALVPEKRPVQLCYSLRKSGLARRHKSDKELYHWLTIFANSIYGRFVEINPVVTPQGKPARVHSYSGEESFEPEKRYQVGERPGRWYAPYLASLVASGAASRWYR
jgi:hypothetical protein